MDVKSRLFALCVASTVLAGCNGDGSGESTEFAVAATTVVSTTDGDQANRRAITPQVMLERKSLTANPLRPRPFEPGYFTGVRNPLVVAQASDVVFLSDARTDFVAPWDPLVEGVVVAENRGARRLRIDFEVTNVLATEAGAAMMPHPQPWRFILNPGERNAIRASVSPPRADLVQADASFRFKVRITNTADYADAQDVEFSLDRRLSASANMDFRTLPDPDAVVAVTVVDAANGAPLSGVPLMMTNGAHELEVAGTDVNGRAVFNVRAWRTARGFDVEYALVANAGAGGLIDRTAGPRVKPGYGQARGVVTPREGQTHELRLELPASAQTLEYTLDKVMDLGIQSYAFDATVDGEVIATVPFHSGFSDEERSRYAYMHVFNHRGDLLWKAFIGDETPAIDVSRDGSLIATVRKDRASDSHGRAVVYDRTGLVRYEYQTYGDAIPAPLPSRVMEVQISDDNRYLMLGDGEGQLVLVDLQSQVELWKKTDVLGQVRKIRFDRNDSVAYVSSGDGFVRCYDMAGQVLWKTYVDAWAPDMEVTERYLVVSSKSSPTAVHVIDKRLGKTMISIPVPHGGNHIAVSPDEQLLWYGTDVGGGFVGLHNVTYTIDGETRHFLGSSGQEAVFTRDSEQLLVKSARSVALYNRDGQALWQRQLAPDGTGDSISHLLWISPDGRHIVAGMNNNPSSRFWGQAYFLSRP